MTSTPTHRRTLTAQVVARAIAGRLPGAVVDETRVTVESGRHTWTGTPDGLAFHIADALHPPRPGSSKAPVPVADLHGWLRGVAATLQDGETLAPGDVQTIYACRFHAILGRSDARAALYALRDEGLLVADDSDPARRVYRRTTPHTVTVTEKTTPAAVAGTAVTPGAWPRGAEAAVLIALARAMREQPTGYRVLAGLEELGEAVVLKDANAVVDWVPALSQLLADHSVVPFLPGQAEVSAAGHEAVIADRIRALGADHPAEDAAAEITAWHIQPLHRRITELEKQRDRRRAELVARRNDDMEMRGLLAPNGAARRVPMPLGERLAPAVDWLIDRIAELEAAAAQAPVEYLASHESVPFGRYTNPAAAVAHIEDLLVQEEGPKVRSRIVWSNPEDEDEEVPVWDVALRDPATGALTPTQYMVTALSLAHDYNREADA
ncbi:hypothetical protein ACFXKG_18280 [Streptomyces sp. NPDC059255]|uniref:hypothetical protein n=1 Tax=Streptomyces sp. NPDC059255 TaxID=3346793 RepID=UPI0036A89244